MGGGLTDPARTLPHPVRSISLDRRFTWQVTIQRPRVFLLSHRDMQREFVGNMHATLKSTCVRSRARIGQGIRLTSSIIFAAMAVLRRSGAGLRRKVFPQASISSKSLRLLTLASSSSLWSAVTSE